MDTLSERSDAVVFDSRKGILPYWTVANGISVGRVEEFPPTATSEGVP